MYRVWCVHLSVGTWVPWCVCEGKRTFGSLFSVSVGLRSKTQVIRPMQQALVSSGSSPQPTPAIFKEVQPVCEVKGVHTSLGLNVS